jgi:hypothetical protein
MKKTILTATAALLLSSTMASAADLDREIGLIVSGVVDKWAGVQFIDDGQDDDTVFANGGEGRLSLPLGSSLSAQMDAKYEYNGNALESFADNDVFGPRYSFQGAFHLSHRDPGSFLLGGLGGVGTASFGNLHYDVLFAGGEAQAYMDNITLYAQGGFVDFDPRGFAIGPMDEGLFARGVLRWFLTPDSRVQLEGTYMNVDLAGTTTDVDIFSVKARYDFRSPSLPLIGEMPLFFQYRGTFSDNCTVFGDVDDHTFMIGSSYSFSGDLLTIDRQGATLDTPDFNHGCSGQTSSVPFTSIQ